MKRVFLSFLAEDRKKVDGLRLIAANPKFDLEFYDESVRSPYNSTDASYVRSKIKEKISRTSITVCLLSEKTHESQWVNWELEESIEQGNNIILMGLPDAPDRLRLPEVVKELGLGWSGWNIDTLKRKIDEA